MFLTCGGFFPYIFSLEESKKLKSMSYKYRVALGKAVLPFKNTEYNPQK
jgi:hypothetical protein